MQALGLAAFRPFPADRPFPRWNDVVRERVAALRREAERELAAGRPADEPLDAIVARKLAALQAQLPSLYRAYCRRRAGTDALLRALAEVAPAPSATVRIAV